MTSARGEPQAVGAHSQELRRGPYAPPWRVRVASGQPSAPRVKGWRDLWPAPTFMLGLLCLALAWRFAPIRRPTPAAECENALALARRALIEGKHSEALAQAKAAWSQVSAAPGRAAELRFLLGSAYLLGGAGVQTGLDGQEAARRARADLEAANPDALPEELRPVRAHRLAQAAEKCGAPPETLLTLWEAAVKQHPPARMEGYARLTALRLELRPPQTEAALAIIDRWLMLPELREPNPVRLLRGELLLRLGRREEARQTLARIPSTATEHFKACDLQAKSLFEEDAWGEAARLWETALPKANDPQLAEAIRFRLGCAYLKLDRIDLAQERWRPLVEAGEAGPEKSAALFRWAEHRAGEQPGPAALALLRTALADLAREGARNPYLDRDSIRQSLIGLLQRWQAARQHAAMIELIEQMGPWAEAGEVDRRLGEAHELAGRTHLADSEQAIGDAERRAIDQARFHFGKAAEAFQRLADQHQPGPSEVSWAWRAAENWLRTGQPARAVDIIEAELRRPLSAERRTEALIALGEALQNLGQSEKAILRLNEALRHSSPLAERAKYLLAVAHIDRKSYLQAEAVLRSLLLSKTVSPEPREVKQARFALGYVLYWQGRHAEAAKALEAAVQGYPEDSQSWTARYWAAEAHRQTALQQGRGAAESKTESARGHYLKQQAEECNAALEQFLQLSALLSARLEPDERGPRRQLERDARIGAVNCLLALDRAAEAVPLCEALALESGGQPDELAALMSLARGQLQLGRMAEARDTLAKLRARLGSAPEEHFQLPRMTRNEWLEWLEQADRSSREGR